MSLPTIQDVANHAGVSTATVSRAINSPNLVSKKTLLVVEKSVAELGFTPNFGGQVLASKRTNTIGAIIPTMDNAIFARGLQAFQAHLSEAGITTIVASTNYDTHAEATQIRKLVARGADALLLIGDAREQATYDFLNKRKIPFVIAWEFQDNPTKSFVGFDNYKAGQYIARLVTEYGHKNIAMISGIHKMNDRARNRARGVRDYLDKHKIQLPIIEAEYKFSSAGVAFQKLLTEYPNLTTIICGNDVLAVGAIQKAKTMGLNVPRDISITGFDDIDIAEVVSPALTTVHVPHRQMGVAAAERLMEMTQSSPSVSKSIELSTHVTIRDSLLRIW